MNYPVNAVTYGTKKVEHGLIRFDRDATVTQARAEARKALKDAGLKGMRIRELICGMPPVDDKSFIYQGAELRYINHVVTPA